MFIIIFSAWSCTAWEASTQEFWYSASIFFRSLLQVLSPFLLLCLVGGGFLQKSDNFLLATGTVFTLAAFSNFVMIFIPYIFYCISPVNVHLPQFSQESLTAVNAIKLTPLACFSSGWAIFYSVMLGFVAYIGGYWSKEFFNKAGKILEKLSNWIVRILMYVVFPPILIGTIVKLRIDNFLPVLIEEAGRAYLASIQLALCVVLIIWYALSKGSIYKLLSHLEGLTKAVGMAFISMSSIIALPSAKEYLKHKVHDLKLLDISLPTLSNIHSLGSSIISGSTALLILTAFGHSFPTFHQYLGFALAFVLAKFSGVATPGGITIIMLPILEKHFGFTESMGTLLLAIDLLTDSFITVMNVLGNGAMALIIDKVCYKVKSI